MTVHMEPWEYANWVEGEKERLSAEGVTSISVNRDDIPDDDLEVGNALLREGFLVDWHYGDDDASVEIKWDDESRWEARTRWNIASTYIEDGAGACHCMKCLRRDAQEEGDRYARNNRTLKKIIKLLDNSTTAVAAAAKALAEETLAANEAEY